MSPHLPPSPTTRAPHRFAAGQRRRLRCLAAILILTSALSGCAPGVMADSAPGSAAVPGAGSTTGSATVAAPCRAVKVAILLDKSRSSVANETQRVTMEHVQPLLGLLRTCGGALGVGVIDERSRRPFEWVAVLPPPVPPAAPAEASNPYEEAERRAAYQRELRQFEPKLRAHDDLVHAHMDAFRTALEPLLQAPATARATNISDAVARADLFLGEPSLIDTDGRRFLLMVTDTQDTVRRPPRPLESGARLLVATAGEVHDPVASLKPHRFESVEAAVAFIVSSTRGDVR